MEMGGGTLRNRDLNWTCAKIVGMRGRKRRDSFGEKRERCVVYLVPREAEAVRRYIDLIREMDVLRALRMSGLAVSLGEGGGLIVGGSVSSKRLEQIRANKALILSALREEAESG